MKVEYRIKESKRYIITRYEGSDEGRTGSVSERGTYDNAEVAYEVAYALAKAEHDRLGYPLDDERIQYPRRVGEGSAPIEAGTALG